MVYTKEAYYLFDFFDALMIASVLQNVIAVAWRQCCCLVLKTQLKTVPKMLFLTGCLLFYKFDLVCMQHRDIWQAIHSSYTMQYYY